MAWNREDFLGFLCGTLIPDLIESGHEYTAEDFCSAVFFIRNPNLNEVTDDNIKFLMKRLTRENNG